MCVKAYDFETGFYSRYKMLTGMDLDRPICCTVFVIKAYVMASQKLKSEI